MFNFYPSQKLAASIASIFALLSAGCSVEEVDTSNEEIGTQQQALSGNRPTNRLRVLSVNVYQKPGLINIPPDPSPLDDAERARKTALRVLSDQHGYDAILLSELFTDEAATTFITELHTTFPHYVVTRNDSGLAIFSRFPFTRLTTPYVGDGLGSNDQYNSIAADAMNGSDRHSHFAFTKFSQSCFPDSLAPKGALLARILGPGEPSQLFNLVVSHTQSDDVSPGGVPLCSQAQVTAIRASQFDQIGALVQAAGVVTQETIGEQLIVSGDLNVQGWRPAYASSGSHDAPPASMLSSEYGQTVFGSSAFRGIPLYDTWRLTSDADMGPTYTSGNPLQRLDYFLLNGASYRPNSVGPVRGQIINQKNFCPQWVRTASMSIDSDHQAVSLDLGIGGPACAPAQAVTVPANLTSQEYLTQWKPSQNYWLYFPHRGTYSIGVPLAAAALGVKADVFLARDLSVAMTQEAGIPEQLDSAGHGGPTLLKPYASAEPFYVRISARNGDVSGDLVVLVKRNNCSSPDQPCALAFPGHVGEYRLPGGMSSGTERRVGHYTINTYDVPVGTATLRLKFSPPAAAAKATVKLTNSLGFSWTGVVSWVNQAFDFPYSSAALWNLEVEEYRVGAQNYFPASFSFAVAYDTNASLVRSFSGHRDESIRVYVKNETGVGIGSDESRCWLRPDGANGDIGTAYEDNLDSGRNVFIPPAAKTFTSSLHASCIEFVNGDGGPVDNGGGISIPALPWGTGSLLNQAKSFAMGGSGEYQVQYSLLKRLP